MTFQIGDKVVYPNQGVGTIENISTRNFGSAFEKFYPAEKYHQNYYKQNGDQPYCSLVIRPKVEKFQKVFKDKLKLKGQH